ncbi:FHA domain-containing protein [Streptomyces sp. NPDC007084]|uniref:FHA domain-containing protein n=1 Tax=Streptomyces sp. NPDC007084 TaxID=3154313 RepID=UPI003452A4A2
MQIRLTVVDPLGPPSEPRGRAAACDVLVTAPAGTALAAVASGLASAVGGGGGTAQGERGREPGGGQIVLYAGAERLDAQRCTLGEPPLTDGAVLGLGAPAEPGPELDDVSAQLHVVAGPDAGGVHLLHGGRIDVGRSAAADIPLDDPDVSRLHCAVTVSPEGRVSVADTGSTNGTTLDGTRVGSRPVRFPEGALLRVGESALRLAPPGGPGTVATAPDGEGHVRVSVGAPDGTAAGLPGGAPSSSSVAAPGASPESRQPHGAVPHARGESASLPQGGSLPPVGETQHAYGTSEWPASPGQVHGERRPGRAVPPVVPEQGGAPRIENGPRGDATTGPGSGSGPGFASGSGSDLGTTSGSGGSAYGAVRPGGGGGHDGHAGTGGRAGAADGWSEEYPDGALGAGPGLPAGRKGTPMRGTDVPAGLRRRGGLGAWARRLTGSRGGPEEPPHETYDDAEFAVRDLPAAAHRSPETWPDPATLLLTALGPGPRLWERGPGHPEALTVRLGTADRTAPDGSGPLPVVPVTAGLREAGSLGLAGPRPRLAGLARAVVAQLAALHSPDTLEIVLISADRARPVAERTAEWSWLGWLPHLRPAHGQDCRLLLAYDREQAAARTDELLRRLEDHLAETEGGPRRGLRSGGEGAGVPGARRAEGYAGGRPESPGAEDGPRGAAHRPAWARAASDGPGGTGPGFGTGSDSGSGSGSVQGTEGAFEGPFTVVVVDGDPGGADVREAVLRLAHEGARAGIHVLCLAETPAASPASPVTETYEAACAVVPAFRACGAVALLSGDVATALRLLRVAAGGTGAALPDSSGFPGSPGSGGLGSPASPGSPGSLGSPGGASRGGSGAYGGSPRPGVEHGGPSAGASPRSGAAYGGPSAARSRDDGSTHLGIPHPGAGRGSGGGYGAGAGHGTSAGPASGAGRGTSAGHGSGAGQGTSGASFGAPASQAGRISPGSGAHPARGPVGHGTVAAVDAVSLAWAERFARALAPLRTDGPHGDRHTRVSAPLPQAARLLDELGLARATPASLMARWADAADDTEALGGRARAVLGAGPRGPVAVDLHIEGPHLLIEGPPGSGRTELLRSVAASLAAAERPDRLGIVLMEGRDGTGGHGAGNTGEGLRVCTDLPHVTTHLTANDPVRMREFAQSLSAELKRRSELLGRLGFGEWHTGRAVSGRLVSQRAPGPASGGAPSSGAADIDTPASSTLRLRPAAARRQAEPGPALARLVVVVDDLDALLSPPLGSPGRPAAGSVVRALEAVAREGDRLGVHLVAAAAADGRTAGSELARSAALRVALEAPASGPDEPAPGRGRLARPDGRETPFQGGRVTGRIPRTATLRPTVVPLEWHRMGDPPTRRPVRELGNGPTDLALLASALERAARSVSATEVPSLL